jgi:hypothetical protein
VIFNPTNGVSKVNWNGFGNSEAKLFDGSNGLVGAE